MRLLLMFILLAPVASFCSYAANGSSFSLEMCVRAYRAPNDTMVKSMIHHCKSAADKEGNAMASAISGMIYSSGKKGVEIDYEKGASYFQSAIDKGHEQSKVQLARLHMIRNGIGFSYEKSKLLLDSALGSKIGSAAFYLGVREALMLSDGLLTDRHKAFVDICKWNTIALDMGYKEGKDVFNRFIRKMDGLNDVDSDSVLLECKEKASVFHNLNGTRGIQKQHREPRKFYKGPIPMHSPEFWFDLIAGD